MNEVELIGYSERGILYSLLYEIGLSRDGNKFLNTLIEKMTFPFTEDTPPLGKVTIYVEPSFSRYFGDSDAIFLIESDTEKCAVFIEAKVGESELLYKKKKFEKFMRGPPKKVDGVEKRNNGHSSTIFMQLYHKHLLMNNSITDLKKKETCEWSMKRTRKIGTDDVVIDTIKKIKETNRPCFYLMLVPDNKQQAADFFEDVLEKQDDEIKSKIPEWDATHFGYLTWDTVKTFCDNNEAKLKNTLAVFKHNVEKIYPTT